MFQFGPSKYDFVSQFNPFQLTLTPTVLGGPTL